MPDLLDTISESAHCPDCKARVRIVDDKVSSHRTEGYRPGGSPWCPGSGKPSSQALSL